MSREYFKYDELKLSKDEQVFWESELIELLGQVEFTKETKDRILK